jgi:hypothetical protein
LRGLLPRRVREGYSRPQPFGASFGCGRERVGKEPTSLANIDQIALLEQLCLCFTKDCSLRDQRF